VSHWGPTPHDHLERARVLAHVGRSWEAAARADLVVPPIRSTHQARAGNNLKEMRRRSGSIYLQQGNCTQLSI